MIVILTKNLVDIKTPTNLAKTPRHFWNSRRRYR